jgi:hypothetical protein
MFANTNSQRKDAMVAKNAKEDWVMKLFRVVQCHHLCAFVLTTFFLAQSTVATAAPDIQHWQTRNGVRVFFVSAAELPIVDVRVVFAAGSARDDGKPGLAQLSNGLLSEGADGLDADAIAQRFEGLGAQFGSGIDRDMAWLSLRSRSCWRNCCVIRISRRRPSTANGSAC